MAEPTQQKQDPEPKETAAEVIERTKRRSTRSAEERCAILEDENSELKLKLGSLEKSFTELADSLKARKSSNGEKSLWDEFVELFEL